MYISTTVHKLHVNGIYSAEKKGKRKKEKIHDPCIKRRNNKNHVDSCFSHSFASLFIKDNFLMLPETRQA